MPVSGLDPAALASLSPGAIADLALSADQEARRARKAGRLADAAAHDREAERLAALFRERS